MQSKIDLYAELGLERNCSQEDVKKAYKKLALQWHPDKNQHRVEESTKKFQMISEAYAILSDEKKRAKYDKYGTVDENDFNFEDFMNDFDFTDIFGAMFDMSMMLEMMGMALKPGRFNGRRMKNLEKQMQKKYEAKSQKMFEKLSKEMFDGDFGDFDEDFDFGFGGKKKSKSKKPKEEEEWETEEEVTDEDNNDKKEGDDNSDDYEDVDDDDSSDEKEKLPKSNGKNKKTAEEETKKSGKEKNEEKEGDDNNDDDDEEEDEDEKEARLYEQMQEEYLKKLHDTTVPDKDMETWLKEQMAISAKEDEELLKHQMEAEKNS